MAVYINTARRKKQFLVGTMCTKSPYYNERSTILYLGKTLQVDVINRRREEIKSKWNPIEAIFKIKLPAKLDDVYPINSAHIARITVILDTPNFKNCFIQNGS